MQTHTETPRLPGFYVRGRYYGFKVSQATARARWLADEHHTMVDVELIDWAGSGQRYATVGPRQAPVSLLTAAA
jgi:hypothetical protein